METTIIVSSKGQVVIPKKIRDAMGIHAGTELLLNCDEKAHALHLSISQKDITYFFGMGKKRKGKEKVDVEAAIASAVLDNDKC